MINKIYLTLSKTSPGFHVSAVGDLLKTLWEKEKLLVTSNFSFANTVWRAFCHFHQIENCRVQMLSI